MAARYALPRELREYKVVCAGADKPLVALALLRALAAERVIVFTSSVESTQRCRPWRQQKYKKFIYSNCFLRAGRRAHRCLTSSVESTQRCRPWHLQTDADF